MNREKCEVRRKRSWVGAIIACGRGTNSKEREHGRGKREQNGRRKKR